MKCLIAFGLLVTLASVICEDDPVETVEPVVEPAVVPKPRPVGIVYLIQLFNEPPVPAGEDDEITNVVPSGNPYKTSKLLLALTPNNFDQDKDVSREKRSPGYGKGGGGGGCNVCGGGGGGYPGGGGHGGGGYPGGGGGFGGGGGGGGSWSQSSAQASSGSFGYGGGGKGYKG